MDWHIFFTGPVPLNGPRFWAGQRNTVALKGDPQRQRAFLSAAGVNYPRASQYSFDFGNSHWTMLDTWNPNVDWNDSRLRTWLARDLAVAREATWKFIGCYFSPFNSARGNAPHEREDFPKAQKMRMASDLFEQGGVSIVFSGYFHGYQRSYPLKYRVKADRRRQPAREVASVVEGDLLLDREFDGTTRTRPHGVLYVVTGGGGATLHNPEQTSQPSTWQPIERTAIRSQFSTWRAAG
jgi:hypothetical protein